MIIHCKKHDVDVEALDGCPQCIAERRAAEQAAKTIFGTDSISIVEEEPEPIIVKVKYSITKNAGTSQEYVAFEGRAYTYFTAEPLNVGDVVEVPVQNHNIKAQVVEINIPESEIVAFRDKVKTIPAGSVFPDAQAVTVVGNIEDTGSAIQPPLVSTGEPIFEEATDYGPGGKGANTYKPEAYGDPKPCLYVPALVCHKAVCANCNHIPTAAQEEGGETFEEEAERLIASSPEPEEFTGNAEEQIPNSLAAAAKAAGAEVKVVSFGEAEEKPAALVTIETQVGKPTNDLFVLYQEAASLLQFAKDRHITTNEDLKPATDDLAIIATCKKAMFARKTELVGPLKAKLDLVNQAFDDIMFPVMEADRLTRSAVAQFDVEQRRKAADAQRIEDEKLRLAREEEKLTGEHTVELGTAPSPPPVPEHTRTDLGTLGGRTNWKARVVDFKLLDDQWKLANESLLNSHARSTKGERPIPGVEFWNDRIITIRGK